MPFPVGNKSWQNREKRRQITNALERELVQFEDEGRGVKSGEAASRIARNIVAAAVGEDKWAIEFLVDRLEGKAAQTVSQSIEHSGVVEHRGLQEISARIEDLLGSGQKSDSTDPVLN